MEPYKPTARDLAFFRAIITGLKDGGVWCQPSCGLIYRKEDATHTFHLEPPDSWADNPVRAWCHHHNHFVFAQLGWDVTPSLLWEEL